MHDVSQILILFLGGRHNKAIGIFMKTVQFQKGLSPLAGLCVAVMVGFFLLMILKLLPHYMDYDAIVKTHKKIATEDPQVLNYSISRLQEQVSLLLLTHQERNYDRKNTYLDESGDQPILNFKYKVREQIGANIYTLLVFEHESEVKQ